MVSSVYLRGWCCQQPRRETWLGVAGALLSVEPGGRAGEITINHPARTLFPGTE